MKTRLQILGAAVAALLIGAASVPSALADYPDKAITMVVGFAAGGGTDAYARGLSSVAQDYLDGQPIAVVNMAGGAGIPAARSVADAPPNGYTLLLSSHGGFILRQLASPQAADPFEDFKYVATVGGLTSGVMVPAASPFQSPQDIVDAARERPGALRWAHSGRGAALLSADVGLLLTLAGGPGRWRPVPGLSAAEAIALLMSAILFNTPGTAAAAQIEGYPLTRQGKQGKALRMAVTASADGDTSSERLLIFGAAYIAFYTRALGPPEYFAVYCCAFVIIGSVIGHSIIKGSCRRCWVPCSRPSDSIRSPPNHASSSACTS